MVRRLCAARVEVCGGDRNIGLVSPHSPAMMGIIPGSPQQSRGKLGRGVRRDGSARSTRADGILAADRPAHALRTQPCRNRPGRHALWARCPRSTIVSGNGSRDGRRLRLPSWPVAVGVPNGRHRTMIVQGRGKASSDERKIEIVGSSARDRSRRRAIRRRGPAMQ